MGPHEARKETPSVRFPAYVAFPQNRVADIYDHHDQHVLDEIPQRRFRIPVPAADHHIGAGTQKTEDCAG